MTVFSKPITQKVIQLLTQLKSFKKAGVFASACFAIIYLIIQNKSCLKYRQQIELTGQKKKSRGQVDKEFLRRLYFLLKLMFPSLSCPEIKDIFLLTVFLLFRTYLSIYLSIIKGKLVRGVIKLDFQMFLKGLITLGMCAVPGSFINSCLGFFQKSLAIKFRRRLTNYFVDQYLKDMLYYKMTNLDSRIKHPDQRLTSDIDKWSTSLSTLYSNISKPLLDIILFSNKIRQLLGWKGKFLQKFIIIIGPTYVIMWYIISGLSLKIISPAFGKMIAVEQQLEGQYRAGQSNIVKKAEEIAFYRGNQWELQRINLLFKQISFQNFYILGKRLLTNCFDGVLVKYGSHVVGYYVLGLPVFGKQAAQYLNQTKKETSQLTRDYIRNSSLLLDLAAAIGRLIISYKNVQMLAGYTTLIFEIEQVLKELKSGEYERLIKLKPEEIQRNSLNKEIQQNIYQQGTNIHNNFFTKIIHEKMAQNGIVNEINQQQIIFHNVPIKTPNGEILVKVNLPKIIHLYIQNQKLNFKIECGMNCIIIGPNGCGKSSVFRILGQLWPCYDGEVQRPPLSKMFYIPQRPYLPNGCLRDQIIYPQSKLEFLRTGLKDKDIQSILDQCYVGHLYQRYKDGLDSTQDWTNELSGGEKQRIAMARLLYHKPKFAILDECTSQTEFSIEQLFYTKCKELQITLFTVSHRPSLFPYHDYLLKFDGEGNYVFKKIEPNDLNMDDFKIEKLKNQEEYFEKSESSSD